MDYMPILPVGTSFYGAASTVLVLSAVDAVTVTETCSDGSTKTFTVAGGSNGAVYQSGYSSHYNGKGCLYTADAPFFAHALGDGADATPFLPASLMTNMFVAPVAYQFVAFVSAS